MLRRRRILITRTRNQASELASRLEALGAETIIIPTIELAAPSSYAPLDAALGVLGNPDHGFAWLIFTSANAVKAFAVRQRLNAVNVYPRRIAVIGPATLKALEQSGITAQEGPALMPETYVAESLAAELLAAAGPSPRHFLLVRAEEARDFIPAALETAGHRVIIAPAYRNITPSGTIDALIDLFGSPETQPEIITFTSSSTARNLFALLESAGIELPTEIGLASIGPVTSATLRELGREPSIEAEEPTIDSLTTAIKSCSGADFLV